MNKAKILELLGDVLDIEKQNLSEMPIDTKLSDLGLSSIQFIQFIVALEEEFKIEILDSDLMLSNFETIGMLYQTLEKYFLSQNVFKKVLICDCDNVLWNGISGEEGIYTSVLTDKLQKAVIDLYNRGVIICLCSKNQPENIEEAFATLEMPLKKEHILISKVNMTDKATNINEIAFELNLSTDSFVFVDDSKYELELVSSIIPEIKTIYADYSDGSFIDEVEQCFEHNSTDINRTKQYREQKEREKEKQLFATAEEFNVSLKTDVKCEVAIPSQALRISELSNRTNQFNLSNTRYNEDEIKSFMSDENYAVYTLSASDKYGDMGIVGAAIVDKSDNPVIISFFLSCRVFGRGFEEILMGKIKGDFSNSLNGIYKKTDKNKRFQTFYSQNGVEIYE